MESYVVDDLDLAARLATPERRLGLREQTLVTAAAERRHAIGRKKEMLSIARALMIDPCASAR